MKAPREQYQARLQRVIDYIDGNLDDDLDLDRLSGLAAFSKFHFHRQFSATFGVSVHRYVQLARLKRASYQLAFRDDESLTQIALDSGYDTPESFARVFRQRIGQSPSIFRKAPEWNLWLEALGPLSNARSMQMPNFTIEQVTIRDFPETDVMAMEHLGHPAKIGETVRKFIAWRKEIRLPPSSSATFNIFHSDPSTTSPEDYRIDMCAATGRKIADAERGVRASVIPAGRCAVLRLIGSSDNLEPAATFLYGEWLPQSGERLRDFPFFCQRVSFFPEVAENETITDLFVPLD